MNTVTGNSKALWMARMAALLALAVVFPAAPAARAQSEVPPGTRFLVELRDKLDARKIKPGKKFELRTLDALQATDGNLIPAWTKIRGRVSYVENNKMVLRVEQIETRRGKVPIVASVVGVQGEKDVRRQVGSEGEIKSASHRGRNAAIGAIVLGGLGATVGGIQGGGKGAAIGGAVGAGTGAAIGASTGGKDLVLYEGTRIEFELDRPLVFRARR